MTGMLKVVIHPDRHFASDPAPFLDELHESGFAAEVVPYEHTDTGGRLGVNWYEVIRVYLTEHATVVEAVIATKVLDVVGGAVEDSAKAALKAAASKIGGAFVDWARKRSRLPGKNPKQPKRVIIYGPDGQVLRTVTVTDPDNEPVIHDP
jgi:hypothetical protein